MTEKKYCPVCHKVTKAAVVDVCVTAHEYLIEKIKKEHPEWVEKNGACPKCLAYYKKI